MQAKVTKSEDLFLLRVGNLEEGSWFVWANDGREILCQKLSMRVLSLTYMIDDNDFVYASNVSGELIKISSDTQVKGAEVEIKWRV